MEPRNTADPNAPRKDPPADRKKPPRKDPPADDRRRKRPPAGDPPTKRKIKV